MQPLDDYEIVRELARGGMGAVYVVRHPHLGRELALKTITRWSPQQGERLEREAQAVAKLTHPHVIQVHALGVHRGTPALIMDYHSGGSLADRLRGGPLPADEAARLTRDLASALAHAHEQGILHRDLKPANVLFDAEGQAILTDFGLAKSLAESREALTRSGDVVGTPAYMSPEQADGGASVGPAADVYGLGATLYSMLTGSPPFQASSLVHMIVKVLRERPAAPRSLREDVPRELEAICLRCLEKDPAKRYASAEDLRAALEAYRSGPPPAPPRPLRLLVALGVGVALLALSLGLHLAQDAGPEPAPATVTSRTTAPEPDEPEPKRSTGEAELDAALALKGTQRVAALERWLSRFGGHPRFEEAQTKLVEEPVAVAPVVGVVEACGDSLWFTKGRLDLFRVEIGPPLLLGKAVRRFEDSQQLGANSVNGLIWFHSASSVGALRIADHKDVGRWPLFSNLVLQFAVADGERDLIAASARNETRCYELREGQLRPTGAEIEHGRLQWVTFAPRGEALLVFSQNRQDEQWAERLDPDTGERRWRVALEVEDVKSAAYSRDERAIYVGCERGRVIRLAAEDGSIHGPELRVSPGVSNAGEILRLAPLEDGRWVVLFSSGRKSFRGNDWGFEVLRADGSRQLRRELPSLVTGLRALPAKPGEGPRIAVAQEQQLGVWALPPPD